MTLTEIVDAHPELFYEGSGWWRGQGFAGVADPLPVHADVRGVKWSWRTSPIYRAPRLALDYTRRPEHPIWRYFLWTPDVDDSGNQVYVGGVGIYGIDRFQIHRHLTPDHRWVTPL
jgi:hypothetical protein